MSPAGGEPADPFHGLDFDDRVRRRASSCGIELADEALAALLEHARGVLRANAALRLTSIVEPNAFIERHLGEAFEGAALLNPQIAGTLLDLGSGNGYPGLPLAAARPSLRPLLAEAGRRKAAFLNDVVARAFPHAAVLERQVQRPDDLQGFGPFRLIVVRAVGNWERILPRLAGIVGRRGDILLWAGESVERVARRAAWRKLELLERRELPGRERSWVWRFAGRD